MNDHEKSSCMKIMGLKITILNDLRGRTQLTTNFRNVLVD